MGREMAVFDFPSPVVIHEIFPPLLTLPSRLCLRRKCSNTVLAMTNFQSTQEYQLQAMMPKARQNVRGLLAAQTEGDRHPHVSSPA